MVVSYTNNYGYTDGYNQHHQVNAMKTNADGGGNGGGGMFFKMFENKSAEEAKRDTSISSNPLDDLYPQQQNMFASDHVIKDYIDNSLLLNAEQVACTNITQHLALKTNVKETLKFLNVQAAKNMVDSKKRNYKFGNEPKIQEAFPMKQNSVTSPVSKGANFFETGVGVGVNNGNSNTAKNTLGYDLPQKNFFMTGNK